MNSLALALEAKHARLEAAAAYNSGTRTAILASCVNSLGEPSYEDGVMFEQMADRYGLYVGRLLNAPTDQVDVYYRAGADQLRGAIQDERVNNILLIGHAAFDLWLAADGPVNWHQAGDMVSDHLKQGTFANLGCGEFDPSADVNIPLGNYVAGNRGVILGKTGVVAWTSDLSNLATYDILPRVSVHQ
jgi:hypothetical protein